MSNKTEQYYSSYFVSSTNDAPTMGDVSPGEIARSCSFKSNHSSSQKPDNQLVSAEPQQLSNTPRDVHKSAQREQSRAEPFSAIQRKYPVLKNEIKRVNHFLGTKRAFLTSHEHKAFLAKKVQNEAWKIQEKSRTWDYQHELNILNSNIKQRDETLRRLSRARQMHVNSHVYTTTGPSLTKKLPKDFQHLQYPRSHVFYFGP